MTSLKDQLTNLKINQKNEPTLPNGASSTFLFDFKHSNRVDLDIIYDIGYTGMLELSRYDSKFIKFIPLLFDNTAKYFNRETKTKEELQAVDKHLHSFIIALSPYFLHKPTHKILEFLIKVYNVNFYNHKILLFAFLPYHLSKFFVKLIQNFNSNNFLSMYSQSGSVVTEENIYAYLCKDFVMMKEVVNFYEDNMATCLDIDDSKYFNFITEVFLAKLRTFDGGKNMRHSEKETNSNFLVVLLQFISKFTKSFNAKCENFPKYEELCLEIFCKLLISLENKINLTTDYIRAIMSTLISNILKFSQNKIEVVLNTILIICKNRTQSEHLFSTESMDVLSNLFETKFKRNWRILSESFDISPVLLQIASCSIINDSEDFKLVKKMITHSNLPSLEGLLKNIVKLPASLTEISKEIVSLLEQTHEKGFNDAVVHLIKSNQIEEKAIGKLFDESTDDFTIFINLTGTNIVKVLNTIRLFEEKCQAMKEKMRVLNITTLSGRLSVFEKEIILMEILNMKNLPMLLTNETFRVELLNLFYKIKEDNVKIFTNDFHTKLEDVIVKSFDNEDKNSMKIMTYLILFNSASGRNLSEILRTSDFLFEILQNFEAFCEFLHKKFQTEKFLEEVYHIFQKEIQNDLLKTDLMIKMIKMSLMNKNKPTVQIYKILNQILSCLKNENLFNEISKHMIESYSSEKFDEIIQFGKILIVKNNFDLLSLLLTTKFEKKIGLFLTHILLDEDENIVNKIELFSFIRTFQLDSFSLMASLVYILTKTENRKIINEIFDILARSRVTNLAPYSSLNTAVEEGSVFSGKEVNSFITNLVLHKTEISVNKKYLQNLLASECGIYQHVTTCFLIKLKDEDIAHCTKIFSLFTKHQTDKNVLLKIYSGLLANREYNNEFVPFMENIFTGYLMNYPHSAVEVINLLLTAPQLKCSHTFVELLFNKDNIVLDVLPCKQVIQILTFAMNNSLNPDVITISDRGLQMEIISQLVRTTNQNVSLILYLYDIIHINNNSYYTLDFLAITIDLLSEVHHTNQNTKLTLCHNLHTIINNCTIDGNVDGQITKIKKIIIDSVETFAKSGEEAFEISIEVTQIINILLLCLNKVSIGIGNQPEFDILTKGFVLISNDMLMNIKTKNEFYHIFLNSIVNSIELVFSKDSNAELAIVPYLRFYVEGCFTYLDELPSIKECLSKLFKIKQLLSNTRLISCLIVNITHQISIKTDKNCEEIIFNYLNGDNCGQKDNFEIMLHVLKDADEKKLSDGTVHLNMTNKILINLSNKKNFLILEKAPLILLKILQNLHIRQKHLTSKKNPNSEIFKENSNLLNSFFSFISKTAYVHLCLIEIFSHEEFSKQRNFFLTKYLNEVPIGKNTNEAIGKVFKFLLDYVTNTKEEKVENLKLVHTILTSSLSTEFYTSVKMTLPKLIGNMKQNLSTGRLKNDVQFILCHFALVNLVSKIFFLFDEKTFLEHFNSFFLLLVQSLSLMSNEEIVAATIESIRLLSGKMGEYFSSHLDAFVWNLLSVGKINNSIKTIFTQLGKKIMLDACFNAVKANTKKIITEENQGNVGNQFDVLMTFFKTSLQHSDKLILSNLKESILKYFIKLLLEESLTDEKVIENILDCFKTFVLKINEKQLKSLFADILLFANEKADSNDKYYNISFKFKLSHCVVSLYLLNTILKGISSIFVPYVEKYKNFLLDVISFTNAVFSIEKKQPKGLLGKTAREDLGHSSNGKFSYLTLNSLVLENIRLNFKFNSEQMLSDTMEELFEPLPNQIKFMYFDEEDTIAYFEKSILICLSDVLKNVTNEDLFKQFNDAILNLIREENYLSKLLTLKLINHMFGQSKERYLTLITDIIPYVSDCLEDSNESVHNQAYKTMKVMEKLTGQDFKNYLEG